jgi:negative regulator of flagellin synthesis FlgM
MTTISNNSLPKLGQANAGKAKASTAPSAGGTDAPGASAATGPADQLKLTDSARAIQNAARSGDSAPVDGAKVARIREALASGSYQANPQKIADSMLSMEHQIAGTKPSGGQ